MKSKQKNSGLGPWAIVFVLISAALVVWLTIRSFQQNHRQVLKEKVAEQQADSLAVAIMVFKQDAGSPPLSLVDKMSDGRVFSALLPERACFINPFTGLRTEPRFFDRIYERASPGTLALAQEKRCFYVVVYGRDQRICRKIRL